MVVLLIVVHLLLMGIQLIFFVAHWFSLWDLKGVFLDLITIILEHMFVLSSTWISTIQIGMATCCAL